MSERAGQLQSTAEAQLIELIALLSAADEDVLRRPCPGREKLGDGTVAANVQHTSENYRRIVDFIGAAKATLDAHRPPPHGGHRAPRLLRHSGHAAQERPGDAETRHQAAAYTVENLDLNRLLSELGRTRERLASLSLLTDADLHRVPPSGSFRFCDGQRTLEQVLAGVFRHQAHQLEVIRAVSSG